MNARLKDKTLRRPPYICDLLHEPLYVGPLRARFACNRRSTATFSNSLQTP